MKVMMEGSLHRFVAISYMAPFVFPVKRNISELQKLANSFSEL